VPLETATYIVGLVVTNPDGGDQRTTVDDHIRLIKACLRRTFPNMDGEMSASSAAINNMVRYGMKTNTQQTVSATHVYHVPPQASLGPNLVDMGLVGGLYLDTSATVLTTGMSEWSASFVAKGRRRVAFPLNRNAQSGQKVAYAVQPVTQAGNNIMANVYSITAGRFYFKIMDFSSSETNTPCMVSLFGW
jgi:hypothetical protein